MDPFNIECTRKGDFHVFEISGQLRQHDIIALKKPVYLVLDESVQMVLDCSHLDFIDSSGIGFILKLWMDIKRLDGILYLVRPEDEFCASILEYYLQDTGDHRARVFNSRKECDTKITKSS